MKDYLIQQVRAARNPVHGRNVAREYMQARLLGVLQRTGAMMPLAFQGGTAGWIGVGFNVLILGLASMWLIIDFKLVEDQVNAGAPKYAEWYCGFALLVTLAWIYFEAVKLVFRLAILLNGRD